jgi:hypothetical protein
VLGGTKIGIRAGHILKPFERDNLFTGERELFDPNQVPAPVKTMCILTGLEGCCSTLVALSLCCAHRHRAHRSPRLIVFVSPVGPLQVFVSPVLEYSMDPCYATKTE